MKNKIFMKIFITKDGKDYSIEFDPYDLTILGIKEITSKGIKRIYLIHKIDLEYLDDFKPVVESFMQTFRKEINQ